MHAKEKASNAHEPSDARAIARMQSDERLRHVADEFVARSCEHGYSYNFSWLGRPIIQYPQDLVALQEIIWNERPQLIVETGVAHGGSTVFFASMLELSGGTGRVVAVDIDIRPHNRVAIEQHPFSRRIQLIEGSSVEQHVVDQVTAAARTMDRVMVVLDSNHTHAHVLRELELYSPLVKAGQHIVVFDTVIERLPPETLGERPWSRGNSPQTAVQEFLLHSHRFAVDAELEAKLLISVAPGGYLRCIKD